jgi:hypothetical protein
MIDAREEIDLRFGKPQAAPPGRYFFADLYVVEPVLRRILLQILVIALQNNGNAGIERGERAR